MKLNGARIVAQSLVEEGVKVIFGMPGGTITPFYDVLPEFPIHHVLVRHEQGAAHMADGYGRASRDVGVCCATSGPGAINLVPGIAAAYLDSSPMVAITANVPTSIIGTDAFQECDITGITLPITKHSYLVESVKELPRVMKEAFFLARTGRPGPVLVDVPKDVLLAETNFIYPKKVELQGYSPTLQGNMGQIKKAAALIRDAKRPVIMAGQGVLISHAEKELRRLVEATGIPVVTTLLGIGCFPESHQLSFGLVGLHGMAYANYAVHDSDLLIGIGARFDDRVTGRVEAFAPGAKVIHIDIDPAEIGKNVKTMVPIVGDVKNVLEKLNEEIQATSHQDWVGRIVAWREKHPATEVRASDRLLPQYPIKAIYDITGGNAIVVADVGQHQMWAAQLYWFNEPNTFITSGGMGTMGFSLPAAIGVKMARPDKEVWVVVGDGSLQMTLQELATVVQEKVDIKIALINNSCLGMVRQLQDLFYEKNFVATPLSGPDWVKLAEAYGIIGLRASTPEEVAPIVEKARRTPGPVLLEFQVEMAENVYPMVVPGQSLGEVMVG
ncbi:MAG TPA: biosynthetic-type acetolactate synthase large subunit [Chloroflexota bacterium]|nr:biosynthetic-type acetolactate synthase large subunit [Chloroflexota bacterium]